jgi:hypothetical protein
VFVRGGKIVVVLALVLTTGAHWAALQTIAWTTMLAGNLRSHSVTEAVAQTFDGRHLCPLCRAIATAKNSEQKSAAVSPVLKMEFPPVTDPFKLFAPQPLSAFSAADCAANLISDKPPVPPPRADTV